MGAATILENDQRCGGEEVERVGGVMRTRMDQQGWERASVVR